MKKRICTALLALAAVLSGLTVQAKTDFSHDYILNEETGKESVIPATHECVLHIEYIAGYKPNEDDEGFLNNPQDIFVDDCRYRQQCGGQAGCQR